MSPTGFITFNDLSTLACAVKTPLFHKPDVLVVKIAPDPRDIIWENAHVNLGKLSSSSFVSRRQKNCLSYMLYSIFIRLDQRARVDSKCAAGSWGNSLVDSVGQYRRHSLREGGRLRRLDRQREERLLEAAIGERMAQVRVTPEPALVATVYGRAVACVILIGGKKSVCSRPRLASARCRYG